MLNAFFKFNGSVVYLKRYSKKKDELTDAFAQNILVQLLPAAKPVAVKHLLGSCPRGDLIKLSRWSTLIR